MTLWGHKSSYRQLLLLITCLTISLPGMAGSGLCLNCDCCIPATDDQSADTTSPCCCCTPLIEEQNACCESSESVAMQASCHCGNLPPATHYYTMMEKTDSTLSSLTPTPVLITHDLPKPAVHHRRYATQPQLPYGPATLRSIILIL